MKEQKTYVSIDADSVGSSFGEAALNDDGDQLSSLSQDITAGTQIFVQWAEFNGGTVISNGSDEAILQVPVSALSDLEDLRNKYQEQTGFTISIGTGESISASAKALIYAKMNGKNQVTSFSPEMEDAMKEAMSGSMPESSIDEEIMPHQESGQQAEVAPNEKESGLPIEAEAPEGQVPEHEQNLAPEDKALHDSTEMMGDEEEIQQEELAAQAEDEEVAMEEMATSDNPASEDIDLDGRADIQEPHGEIDPSTDDIDRDGDVEHEEAMMAEVGEEDQYSDEDDVDDDEVDDEYVDIEGDDLAESIEGEMGEEAPMEGEQEMDGMIEGDDDQTLDEMAPEEGEELSEEVPMEEETPMEGEEAPVDQEELKNIIFESLQNFKMHREYLEGIQQENPELYDSLIFVLQAMIEMAKELGYGDMTDDSMLGEEDTIMGESGEETIDDAMAIEEEMEQDDSLEDGDSEDIPMEGEESEEGYEEPEEDGEEDKNKNPFVKSEKFISLMNTMNKTFSLMKGDKKEQLKELKNKVKKTVSKNKNKDKKKEKPKKKGGSNSFCAKSHLKMKAAGKDCRSNEDENSPMCMARKKFSCRGKNEEKGSVSKSEGSLDKVKNFVGKNRKK